MTGNLSARSVGIPASCGNETQQSHPTLPNRAGDCGPLTVVSLFAGIGGFDLGLERAGMRVVAQCEISEKCRHLLRTHWPDAITVNDITTMTAGDVPGRVNVLCGGFPCQDISFAGKGAGLAGERSGLWSHYARLIGEFRPDYVIVENVAALLGRGLGDVLGDLAALGYDAWWDCIPAAAVGAPHRRDRLWIVAYPRGFEHEGFGDALRREISAELSRAFAEQGLHAGHDPEADAFDPDAHGLGSHRQGVDVVGDAELRDEQVGLFEPLGGDVADAARFTERDTGNQDQAINHQRHARLESTGRGDRQPLAESDPAMANALFERSEGCGLPKAGERHSSIHTQRRRQGQRRPAVRQGGWWTAEPDVGRVAHGVPARVDRLHGLGNAVVPQIPEIIGRAILTARASLQHRAAA